jgi:hypothetical protein
MYQIIAYQNKFWCRFFPSYQSLIGSRSEHTLNLITISIKPCYSSDSTFDDVDECSFLDLVYGRIPDGRTEDSRCLVRANKMYTLIISMSWELDLIKKNVERFWSTLYPGPYGKYSLLFISSTKEVPEKLCYYKYVADSVSLLCVETFHFLGTLASKAASSTRVWLTSMEVEYSPRKTLDTVDQRLSFNQQRVDQFLMIAALKKANESARIDSPEIRDPAQMRISSQYESLFSSTVLVDDLTTRFISCFEKPSLKFEMYVKPFELEVWISLVICCSIITVLIYVYNRILHLSESFSPIFFFVSTLVEEPYSVPSPMWNSRLFKTITMSWVLTALVFTNLYIGLMISDVTAPVRGEIFNTFDKVLGMNNNNTVPSVRTNYDIRDFWESNYTKTIKLDGAVEWMYRKGCSKKYAQSPDDQYESSGYESHHAQFRTSESFAILQKEIDMCEGYAGLTNEFRMRFQSHPWLYNVFHRLFDELIQTKRLYQDLLYLGRLYAFFSPRNRHYPKDPKFSNSDLDKIPIYSAAAIEKELVACGRSIFVGERKETSSELFYLQTNYPRRHFYISNDTFEAGWSTPILWIFMNTGNSKVPQYFKLLLEGGVRDAVLELRTHRYYMKRRVGTQFVQKGILREENIGMSGSIQTIFIISFAFLLTATLVFLLEVIYMNKYLLFYTFLNSTIIKTVNTIRICISEFSTLQFTVRRRK